MNRHILRSLAVLIITNTFACSEDPASNPLVITHRTRTVRLDATGSTLFSAQSTVAQPDIGSLRSAYSLAYSASTWTSTTSFSPALLQRLGGTFKLSHDGERLVAQGSREILLFRRNGLLWQLELALRPTELAINSAQFGSIFDIDADVSNIAVGVPDINNGAGGVYIFSRTATGWSEVLVAPNVLENEDAFGSSVALSTDGVVLAVGATGEESSATGINGDDLDNTAPNSGAVFVYSKTQDVWQREAYIKASNTDADDNFGFSVDLSRHGNTLAVGTPYEKSASIGINGDQQDNSLRFAGAVYVFGRDVNLQWSQQAYIKVGSDLSDDSMGVGFGEEVILSDAGPLLVKTSSISFFEGPASIFEIRQGRWSWVQDISVDFNSSSVDISANAEVIAVGLRSISNHFGVVDDVQLYRRGTDGLWSEAEVLSRALRLDDF